MIKNSHKQTGSAQLIIVIILAVLLVGALGYIFWQNFIDKGTQDPGSTKDEPSSTTVRESQDALVSKDLMTSDNLGITYKVPSTWTGGEYGGGDTLSDRETVTLTSEDGFVITMTISRLIRGWTEDSPSSTILDVQQTKGTDISWLVVESLNGASGPIGLQINSAQDIPDVGSQKVAGSSIYKLGEVDGSGVYLEAYGSFDSVMTLDDFTAKESVKQAKALFESIKVNR